MTPDVFAHQADAWIDCVTHIFEHAINAVAIVLLAFVVRKQQIHAQTLGRIETKTDTIIANTAPGTPPVPATASKPAYLHEDGTLTAAPEPTAPELPIADTIIGFHQDRQVPNGTDTY